MKKLLAVAAGLSIAAAPAWATQGVTDTEVVIGSANDLSGPFAAFGAPAIKAPQLHFDELNANGRIHGRKIRLVVEDHGYQVPKAVQAANKLVNRDKVFAMLLSLGTPHNIAAFKLLDAKGIPNVSPLSSARQMLQDPIKYKFAGISSYYDGVKATVDYMAKEKHAKTVCSMYIPRDFGTKIQEAEVDMTKVPGLTYGGETT